MKKILSQIVILFLLASCDRTQKTDFESGILWQIESESGRKSYVFGTLHTYPRNEIELPEKIFSVLQECDVLALERKFRNQLEQQTFADFQMPSYFLERNRVIVAEHGDSLVSMERELVAKALEYNMLITGLESTDEGLNTLKAVKDIKMDENALVKEQILEDFKKIISQYKAGAIDVIYNDMRARMGDEIVELLVDRRNKNWMDNIEHLIQKENTFFAVGAGHLGGENGILNLMVEKGFRINKVE